MLTKQTKLNGDSNDGNLLKGCTYMKLLIEPFKVPYRTFSSKNVELELELGTLCRNLVPWCCFKRYYIEICEKKTYEKHA